jgi:hypothetical protein
MNATLTALTGSIPPIRITLGRLEATRRQVATVERSVMVEPVAALPPGYHDLLDRLAEDPERWDGLS